MEGDYIKINHWLTPLSWFYGIAVNLRNWLFDIGLLRQRSYNIPVIAVGNLTVGGCGKTPHVEYLVRLLKNNTQVAVLSRGYKRQSSGYVLAQRSTTMPEIGDEPFQMKRKFPDVHVAVDANRCHGIDQLLENPETKNVEVILLDDAFQHRYVKPGLNILLVDYHRLIIYDKLLPAGRLREPKEGKQRADIVIVTKCPYNLKPMDYRVLTKALELRPYQKLFFTSIGYEPLQRIDGQIQRPLTDIRSDEQVLLISGIASPEQIINDIKPYCKNVHALTYSDHHQFTQSDIENINTTFEKLEGPKVIITTEKDAARLRHTKGLSAAVRANLFVLPIEIKFNLEQTETFNEKILNYVKKNSRNSTLSTASQRR